MIKKYFSSNFFLEERYDLVLLILRFLCPSVQKCGFRVDLSEKTPDFCSYRRLYNRGFICYFGTFFNDGYLSIFFMMYNGENDRIRTNIQKSLEIEHVFDPHSTL